MAGSRRIGAAMISRELKAEMVRLYHAEAWRVGTIARQLRVHHGTVCRVLKQSGITLAPHSLRPSMLDAYMPFIQEVFERYPTLRASRLYRMVRERGYRGSADHFRHRVAPYRPRPTAEAYLRLRTLPGEQGQVDWAHFGHLTIGRARRPLMAFVMVLSYSRHLFVRFYLNAMMGSFLDAHVRAFTHFAAERGVHLATLTRGLLELLDSHGAAALEAALRAALREGIAHLASVRHFIDQQRARRGQSPPLPVALPNDPRVRHLSVRPHPLADYEPLNLRDPR